MLNTESGEIELAPLKKSKNSIHRLPNKSKDKNYNTATVSILKGRKP